jgi:hypothetical protein
VGVSECSSGMPLARGPWKRTTTMVSVVIWFALKACLHRVLIVEDAHGGFDHVAVGGDGGYLDDPAPEVARKLLQPALRLERIGRGAQDAVVQRGAGALGPDKRPSISLGSCGKTPARRP